MVAWKSLTVTAAVAELGRARERVLVVLEVIHYGVVKVIALDLDYYGGGQCLQFWEGERVARHIS